MWPKPRFTNAKNEDDQPWKKIKLEDNLKLLIVEYLSNHWSDHEEDQPWKTTRTYIAINLSKTEQRLSPLYRLLPRRWSKGGSRPAPVDKDDHWVFPDVELTNLEKRIIVATMVQIGVLVMFNTHVYSFNGEMFLQKAGGPIGLRSTCAVDRITMNEWDTR